MQDSCDGAAGQCMGRCGPLFYVCSTSSAHLILNEEHGLERRKTGRVCHIVNKELSKGTRKRKEVRELRNIIAKDCARSAYDDL